MSLLLDALQRASKDKAALAAAQATGGARPGPGTPLESPVHAMGVEFPALSTQSEPEPEPEPEPVREASPRPRPPAVADAAEVPEFELEPATLSEVGTGPGVVRSSLIDAATHRAQPFASIAAGHAPSASPSLPAPPSGGSVESTRSADTFKAQDAPPPPPPPPSDTRTQAAARAIWTANTPAKAPRTRRAWLLGGVATCLALGLGSLMFGVWGDPERLLGLTGGSSVTVVSAPAPAPAPAPTALPPDVPAIAPAATTEAAVKPATGAALNGGAAAAPSAGMAPGTQGVAVPATPASSPQPMADAVSAPPVAKPSTAPPKAVVLRPSSSEPVFSSKATSQGRLEQGYAALLDGRLDDAALAYGAVLAGNPNERDALLGLAYVAHSKGRREEAQALYRKVLREEPGNSVANAGLIALDTAAHGVGNGERAKALAARKPDSASVQALAASALAQEGLLAEAALAFARAQALEPTNPWHSYNVAVALDKLGNHAQALEHYDRALQLRGQSPAPLGALQIESARLRVTQIQQSQDETAEPPR